MTDQNQAHTEQRLEELKTLLANGQKQIERQEQFVTQISGSGDSLALAVEVLAALRYTQTLLTAEYRRLLAKLSRDQSDASS
jgi:hypothetical protein